MSIGNFIKGAVAHGVSRSIKFSQYFFVASLCSFICLQAVYQLSGAVCKATWNGYPSYLLLTFISHFVIDFLSIRKVIIFSAIVTDDRHPLRSRSIHQNAAKLHDDSFSLYCAIEGGMENLLRTLT